MPQQTIPKLKNFIFRLKSHSYFRNKPNLFLFFSAVLLNIAIWILLYLRIKPSQYPIPLHFNIYFGIDVIDNWYNIFVIPLLGFLFCLINFFLAGLIFESEKLFSYFLNAVSLFVQILLILGAVSSILIQS
ncbi:MAG: hypothetical protein AB1465_02035 [Patescibacteria group bacterium]